MALIANHSLMNHHNYTPTTNTLEGYFKSEDVREAFPLCRPDTSIMSTSKHPCSSEERHLALTATALALTRSGTPVQFAHHAIIPVLTLRDFLRCVRDVQLRRSNAPHGPVSVMPD